MKFSGFGCGILEHYYLLLWARWTKWRAKIVVKKLKRNALITDTPSSLSTSR